MDVRVQLTGAVSLSLHVAEGSTVKQVREALAVLGGGPFSISHDANPIEDDAAVPDTIAVVREARTRPTSAKTLGAGDSHAPKPTAGGPKTPKPTPKAPATRSAPAKALKTPTKDRPAKEKVPAARPPAAAAASAASSSPRQEKPALGGLGGSGGMGRSQQFSRNASSTAGSSPPSARGAATTPELEEARARLLKVTPHEVRKTATIPSPPPAVLALMEHVLLALGSSSKSWETACHELGDMKFMRRVAKIEPALNDRNQRKIEQFLSELPAEDAEEIKKVGGHAAVALHGWLGPLCAAMKTRSDGESVPNSATHESPRVVVKRSSTATRSAEHKPPRALGGSTTPTRSPPDYSNSTEPLAEAVEELKNLKNSDFRELRTLASKEPAKEVMTPLCAMAAAFGKKDPSTDVALRMMLNPAAFTKQLIDAALDPQKQLALGRSEFIAFQRLVNNPALMQPTKETIPALRAITQWVKAVYAFVSKLHKPKGENGTSKPAKQDGKDEEPTPREDPEKGQQQQQQQPPPPQQSDSLPPAPEGTAGEVEPEKPAQEPEPAPAAPAHEEPADPTPPPQEEAAVPPPVATVVPEAVAPAPEVEQAPAAHVDPEPAAATPPPAAHDDDSDTEPTKKDDSESETEETTHDDSSHPPPAAAPAAAQAEAPPADEDDDDTY
ncbi:hypothetical protein DIPPA_12000 [Diplonema papillatum]|nr:hypothetical protein DIPPA_12000 [Diplonema papillatum]